MKPEAKKFVFATIRNIRFPERVFTTIIMKKLAAIVMLNIQRLCLTLTFRTQ